MRKKLILGILVMGVLTFAACGNGGTGDATNNTNVQTEKTEQKEEKKEDKKKEISMEILRNHEESAGSDFQFRESDVLLIEKYVGNDEIVVIPEEYNGKKITSISSKAFGEESGVKAVKLSDSIESITGCFMDNADLEYVICGSGLKEIGTMTFVGCTSLKELELQEGVEKVDTVAFGKLLSLKKLHMPASVVEFAPTNFIGCNEELVVEVKKGSILEQYMIELNDPDVILDYEVYE